MRGHEKIMIFEYFLLFILTGKNKFMYGLGEGVDYRITGVGVEIRVEHLDSLTSHFLYS